MYDLADSVKIVEPHQALLRHDSDERKWCAFVIVSFDDLKKVDTKDLEDHHKMLSVRPMMDQAV